MKLISRKDYGNVSGHFGNVKEYFLEAPDLMSNSIKYYNLKEVVQSANSWWNFFFLFEKVKKGVQ